MKYIFYVMKISWKSSYNTPDTSKGNTRKNNKNANKNLAKKILIATSLDPDKSNLTNNWNKQQRRHTPRHLPSPDTNKHQTDNNKTGPKFSLALPPPPLTTTTLQPSPSWGLESEELPINLNENGSNSNGARITACHTQKSGIEVSSKKLPFIIGDSMVKGVDGYLLIRSLNIGYVGKHRIYQIILNPQKRTSIPIFMSYTLEQTTSHKTIQLKNLRNVFLT